MGNRRIQRGLCYRKLVRPAVCLTCVLAAWVVGGSCLRSRLQAKKKVWETSDSSVPDGSSPHHAHRTVSAWCYVDERENIICLFIIKFKPYIIGCCGFFIFPLWDEHHGVKAISVYLFFK